MSHLTFKGSFFRAPTTSPRTLGHRVTAGSTFLTVTTLSLACSFALLYFIQINFIAQKGLQITYLEKTIAQHKKENTELSNTIDQKSSLQFTKEVATKELGLEEVDQVVYWNSKTTLAKR